MHVYCSHWQASAELTMPPPPPPPSSQNVIISMCVCFIFLFLRSRIPIELQRTIAIAMNMEMLWKKRRYSESAMTVNCAWTYDSRTQARNPVPFSVYIPDAIRALSTSQLNTFILLVSTWEDSSLRAPPNRCQCTDTRIAVGLASAYNSDNSTWSRKNPICWVNLWYFRPAF